MLDLLKEVFKSPAGSFGSMFAIATFLFFLIYKAGKVVEKFKVVDVIQNNIDNIKTDIAEIKAFIQVFRQDSNPFAKSHSPISLTELGTNVAIDLHIERAINNCWEKLKGKIKERLKKEDNPYDIQGICFSLGEKYSKMISEDEFDYIKTYAFNKGYNLSDFDVIFGILIRDKYFLEANIDVGDVDNHDPTKVNNK